MIWRRRGNLQWRFCIGKPCRLRVPKSQPFNLRSFVSSWPTSECGLLLIQHTVGPIQVASTLGCYIAVVISKLSAAQPRACTPWKRCAAYLLGLHAPAPEPGFLFLSAAPAVPKKSPIQAILAQCVLTSVFKLELVFLKWQGPLTMSLIFINVFTSLSTL